MSVLVTTWLEVFDPPQLLVVGAPHLGEHAVDLVWVIRSGALGPAALPVILGLFTWPSWGLFFLCTCPASHCCGETSESGDLDFSPIILLLHSWAANTSEGLHGQAQWAAALNVGHRCFLRSFVRGTSGLPEWV